VLVHDMGENWELVSDALNSIVQLKVVCLISSFSLDIYYLTSFLSIT
jgi:hypothetical protein